MGVHRASQNGPKAFFGGLKAEHGEVILAVFCFYALSNEMLHPDQYWNYHWCLIGAREEESGQNVGQIIFHIIEIDWIHVAGRILNRLLDENPCLVEKAL